MTAIPLLSSQPWVDRLGWTLIHFLWQGTLLACLYAVARAVTGAASARARYLLSCATLAIMLAAPVATWIFLGPHSSAAASSPPSANRPARSLAVPPAVLDVPDSPRLPAPFLPWVVAVWLAGSLALWVRLVGGWALTVRLRSTHVRPAPPEWQRLLDRLAARVRVSRPVRLLISSVVRAPAVAGWLRPAILVPAGALAGLPAAQLEALLLHELAHIRRGDFLVNLLQSAAEALLFYHPAVWWVSGHIRAEREMCCDDDAVLETGDVLTYACALASLESARGGQLHAAVAANGGSLGARVARLLGYAHPAPRTLSGFEIAAAGMLLAAAAGALYAQSVARPKFEVASIKPAAEQGFMMIRPAGGGRLTASAPVMMLIQASHSLQAFQIVGAPAWLQSERYEIEAKAEGNPPNTQLMLMLQSLLEDRFQLKTHRETRDLPGYALTLVKGGKLTPPKEGSCQAFDPQTPPPPPGQAGFAPCGFVRTAMGPAGLLMQGGKVGMKELARVLSMSLGRPVSDQTGFTGVFDLNLEFAPDASLAGLPRPTGASEPPPDNGRATIFSALQEQLGLKLEAAKSPVDVLVIDHVERPSAN
jgi:uncharacterized protein (TIGR03435 family)